MKNIKKSLFFIITLILIFSIVITGCSNRPTTTQQTEPEIKEVVEKEGQDKVEKNIDEENDEQLGIEPTNSSVNYNNNNYLSPFTGLPIEKQIFQRGVMVSVENSPQARPQTGLEDALIVYEFLVEGGITRFLAFYWPELPQKVGPIRSVRPYFIKTALEYDALLLHAGASPMGFNMLNRVEIEHLDQIFKGSYYWRSSDRNPPHNLYTGGFKIKPYLNKITGIEYKPRFSFQKVSFIQSDSIKASNIFIDSWGDYQVIYKFSESENLYYRFLGDRDYPHLTTSGKQLTAKNIIVQYVPTRVIDDVGRLEMELEGKGEALIFRDGIVIKGYWEKRENNWTTYYDDNGEEVFLTPGKTWIQIIPTSSFVIYKE